MKNTNKLSIGKAVFVTIFLYISISIAQADNNKHKQCSVATLNGSFGYTVTGALISGSFAGPFAATGKLTFDGAGNLKIAELSAAMETFYRVSKVQELTLSIRTVWAP